jgi:hypothetical protein
MSIEFMQTQAGDSLFLEAHLKLIQLLLELSKESPSTSIMTLERTARTIGRNQFGSTLLIEDLQLQRVWIQRQATEFV